MSCGSSFSLFSHLSSDPILSILSFLTFDDLLSLFPLSRDFHSDCSLAASELCRRIWLKPIRPFIHQTALIEWDSSAPLAIPGHSLSLSPLVDRSLSLCSLLPLSSSFPVYWNCSLLNLEDGHRHQMKVWPTLSLHSSLEEYEIIRRRIIERRAQLHSDNAIFSFENRQIEEQQREQGEDDNENDNDNDGLDADAGALSLSLGSHVFNLGSFDYTDPANAEFRQLFDEIVHSAADQPAQPQHDNGTVSFEFPAVLAADRQNPQRRIIIPQRIGDIEIMDQQEEQEEQEEEEEEEEEEDQDQDQEDEDWQDEMEQSEEESEEESLDSDIVSASDGLRIVAEMENLQSATPIIRVDSSAVPALAVDPGSAEDRRAILRLIDRIFSQRRAVREIQQARQRQMEEQRKKLNQSMFIEYGFGLNEGREAFNDLEREVAFSNRVSYTGKRIGGDRAVRAELPFPTKLPEHDAPFTAICTINKEQYEALKERARLKQVEQSAERAPAESEEREWEVSDRIISERYRKRKAEADADADADANRGSESGEEKRARLIQNEMRREWGEEYYTVARLTYFAYFEVYIEPDTPITQSIANSTIGRLDQQDEEAGPSAADSLGYAEFMPDDRAECIAIGIANERFPLTRKMPGWDRHSYGWHSDDSSLFHRSGMNIRQFCGGQTFGAGDTVGCLVNYRNGNIAFTLNGTYLGVAFQNAKLMGQYFAVVGLDSNRIVRLNAGRIGVPFQFDLIGFEASLTSIVKELDSLDLKRVQAFYREHSRRRRVALEELKQTMAREPEEERPQPENRNRGPELETQ